MSLLTPEHKDIRVRIKNTPDYLFHQISDVRKKHLRKFISLKGIVRQKTDVRPQAKTSIFRCPSCGAKLSIMQLEKKFREPPGCSCGRKSRFTLISNEFKDTQKIVLEESPEELSGSAQPKRINVFLTEDLASPFSDKKTNPGSKIIVTGILKEVPIPTNDGGKLTRFDWIIEANFIETIEEDFFDIEISPEEKEEIIRLSKDETIFDKLVNSIAPTIYGHKEIKSSLVLQLFGGVLKKREKGNQIRGDIHILLIGDPGAGKSQLLKRVSQIAPRARFVSGKGASGAGLTATVVKDDFIRGYALEAGMLVLANRGIACIDELDKMSREDRSAMHEALEQQTVTISKANVQATLKSETTVLAAANPKYGRFDPYESLAKQINLPPTLINRFDLIFPIRDVPNQKRDERLASFLLTLHKGENVEETPLDGNLLKKYFAFARQTSKPVLTDSAIEEIKKYYVEMRNSNQSGDTEMLKPIPISARQLEALVRLSEASAKIRFSKTIEQKDARTAIELVQFTLRSIGTDPETGEFDIDRISSVTTFSERNVIKIIKNLINELAETEGEKIPIEKVIISAKEKGIKEEKASEVIVKLVREGELYEPRPGTLSRIG